MALWLITGANRGIGLEMCRQVRGRGDDVIGACRRASAELRSLPGVEVVEDVDVTDAAAIGRLGQVVGGHRLDVLVNNAGILERTGLDELDLDSIRRQFEVNALGPLRVTRALLGSLRGGSRVVLVTSLMGSIADNGSGSHYGYRMSKAALNIAGVSLAHDLRPRGIAVAILHPGMVSTAMTGGRGVSPEESVRGLLARIDELTLETSGTFRHADGRALPW